MSNVAVRMLLFILMLRSRYVREASDLAAEMLEPSELIASAKRRKVFRVTAPITPERCLGEYSLRGIS